MKSKKEVVTPHEVDSLSLTIEPEKGKVLNEMARAQSRSKASIIRELLYAGLAKWEQSRGAA